MCIRDRYSTAGGNDRMYCDSLTFKTRSFMTGPGLYHLLFISAALFFIGVYGFFTRRNLITMLMSLELVLNSVNLNFIAFNKYLWPDKLAVSYTHLTLP